MEEEGDGVVEGSPQDDGTVHVTGVRARPARALQVTKGLGVLSAAALGQKAEACQHRGSLCLSLCGKDKGKGR